MNDKQINISEIPVVGSMAEYGIGNAYLIRGGDL